MLPITNLQLAHNRSSSFFHLISSTYISVSKLSVQAQTISHTWRDGSLEIYSLPTFDLVFSARNFSSSPRTFIASILYRCQGNFCSYIKFISALHKSTLLCMQPSEIFLQLGMTAYCTILVLLSQQWVRLQEFCILHAVLSIRTKTK